MENAILWVMYFYIYSVLGWVAETIYCSVGQRSFAERGFLNGPYCPIYGFGAIIILQALYPYTDHLRSFSSWGWFLPALWNIWSVS